MGTLQLLDRSTGSLKIVASRGFAEPFLTFFQIVRTDSNSACGAALTRRMRVIVHDVSTSYLFVGTAALEIMKTAGVAGVHATPVIDGRGRMWGVFSIYWRRRLTAEKYNPALLDRCAADLADHLQRRFDLGTPRSPREGDA
jgi:hypothetical protein